MEREQFNKIVAFVIDNLEGGYFHPQMLADGRIKDQRYSNSGETMFGIDRKAGGAINLSPAGKEFWAIIDKANAANTWKWNYKGGELAPRLKELVGDMMFPLYDKYCNRFMLEATKDLVNSDSRLIFNFSYACWNGAGWFQKFARIMNDAVSKGIINIEQLVKVAVDARKNDPNSLIKQGGGKIELLMTKINF